MRFRSLLAPILLVALNGAAAAQRAKTIAKEADAVLSPTFDSCFHNAPLNSEAYSCLDHEYYRLDALLTKEYRAALARQPDDASRSRLQRNERKWWRIRFRHCRADVGDFRGSTAAVLNEFCEIETLAKRIVGLRHDRG